MQTTETTANESSATGVPPQDRDEDSGLHDIRSMASSTKMRLSSRRVATTPPVDDDILASSSAGWKAVALPEPARMVALPELTELPPAAEVQHADKRERTSAKKLAKAAVAIESKPIAMAAAAAPAAATSVEPAAVTPIVGARFAQQSSPKSRTGLYAALGLGLAAAAGAAFFVMTNKSEDKAAPQQVAAVEPPPVAPAAAPATTVTTTPIEPTPPPAEPEPAPEAAAIASDTAAAAEPVEAKAAAPAKADRKRSKDAAKLETKSKGDDKADAVVPVETKKPAGGATATGGEGGEPSFDQLLKEAGVQDQKPKKPKLEKKALSGADIKAGMSSVSGKAQACYAGTQGTAQVKLTVGPDGKVQKVTVTGAFAGTPVASCVAAAVKSATFPPWDGGPQSFGYSYLLAE